MNLLVCRGQVRGTGMREMFCCCCCCCYCDEGMKADTQARGPEIAGRDLLPVVRLQFKLLVAPSQVMGRASHIPREGTWRMSRRSPHASGWKRRERERGQRIRRQGQEKYSRTVVRSIRGSWTRWWPNRYGGRPCHERSRSERQAGDALKRVLTRRCPRCQDTTGWCPA